MHRQANKGGETYKKNARAQFFVQKWSVLRGFSAVKWHVWSDISPLNCLFKCVKHAILTQIFSLKFRFVIGTTFTLLHQRGGGGGGILQLFSQNGHIVVTCTYTHCTPVPYSTV